MPYPIEDLSKLSSDQVVANDIWFVISHFLNAQDTFNLGRADKNLFNMLMLEVYRKALNERRPSYKIIKGEESNFCITRDGRVLAWGQNANGELGLGDTQPRVIPTFIPDLKDIQAIAPGSFFTFFLNKFGRVFVCGGSNKGEQFVIGNSQNRLIPTLLTTLHDIKTVAASSTHALFLNTTGLVFAAGANYSGQLGMGNTQDYLTPTLIPSLQNMSGISAGNGHSLFLSNAGHVFACGGNSHGQLGLGDTQRRETPTPIPNMNNIHAVEGGFLHSLFLNNSGHVFSCGWNHYGQLGQSAIDDCLTPMQINNLRNIQAMAATDHHSLFLNNKGQVFGCGGNYYSQLGLSNAVTKQYTPRGIPNLQDIQAITANSGQSYFLNRLGQTFACGYNKNGRLGCNSTDHVFQPTLLSSNLHLLIRVVQIPLPSLMHLAHDQAFYGKLCYEACINYLSSMRGTLLYRKYEFELSASPWAGDSLLRSFTAKVLKDNVYKNNSSSAAFFSMLTCFITIYYHLKEIQGNDPSKITADQKRCHEDFVGILQKMSQGEITEFSDLKTHGSQTDKLFTQSKPNFFSKLTPYNNLRAAWVKSIENDPRLLSTMQVLAKHFIGAMGDLKNNIGITAKLM